MKLELEGRKAGRQSKIEKLPKALQDEINKLLQDGAWTYQRIIEALEGQLPEGVSLTQQNLSDHWKKRLRPLLENEQAMREALQLQSTMSKDTQIDLAAAVNNKLMTMCMQIATRMDEHITQAMLDDDLYVDKDLLEQFGSLVLSLKGLEQAGRVNQQREEALRKAEREKAVAVVQKVAKQSKGLSKETVAEIRRGILGIA